MQYRAAMGQLMIPLKFWIFLFEKNQAISSKYADKCRHAKRLIPEAACVTNPPTFQMKQQTSQCFTGTRWKNSYWCLRSRDVTGGDLRSFPCPPTGMMRPGPSPLPTEPTERGCPRESMISRQNSVPLARNIKRATS